MFLILFLPMLVWLPLPPFSCCFLMNYLRLFRVKSCKTKTSNICAFCSHYLMAKHHTDIVRGSYVEITSWPHKVDRLAENWSQTIMRWEADFEFKIIMKALGYCFFSLFYIAKGKIFFLSNYRSDQYLEIYWNLITILSNMREINGRKQNCDSEKLDIICVFSRNEWQVGLSK